MSNLEHLVENGLYCLEERKNYEDWYQRMLDDCNWSPHVGLTIDDLWEICQYVIYRYCWSLKEERDELIERVYGNKKCLK